MVIRRVPYTRLCTCASCAEVDRFFAKRVPKSNRASGMESPAAPAAPSVGAGSGVDSIPESREGTPVSQAADRP